MSAQECYWHLFAAVDAGDMDAVERLLSDPETVESIRSYCASKELLDYVIESSIRKGNLFLAQRLLGVFGRSAIKFPESLALETVRSKELTDEQKETMIRDLAKDGPLELHTKRQARVLSKWYPSGFKDVRPELWTEEAIRIALRTQKPGIVDALHNAGKVPMPDGQKHLADTKAPHWKERAYIANFRIQDTPEYATFLTYALPMFVFFLIGAGTRRC